MKIFAAIYIGSHEVSLKIFELAARKPIREIDYIRSRVESGKDSYQKGYIGSELVEELGSILTGYKKIMEGYRADAYTAYASGVFRDVKTSCLYWTSCIFGPASVFRCQAIRNIVLSAINL